MSSGFVRLFTALLNPFRQARFIDHFGLLMAVIVITVLENPGADYQEVIHNKKITLEVTQRGPLRMPVNKTFNFVLHSHIDPGWLVTMQEYEEMAVKHILNSTTSYLSDDPSSVQLEHNLKKFTFDAISFVRNWISKEPEKKELLQSLVSQQRLNLINGGISMHDQACCYVDDIIANYEYGREYTKNVLGVVPFTAWSVDPFGASRGSARLFAEMGFDSLGLNRMPPSIKAQKRQDRELIFWWRNSNSTYNDLLTFTVVAHYATPNPFRFHRKFPKHFGQEPPNTDMLQEDFNLMKGMVEFTNNLIYTASAYKEKNIMLLIGDDFAFSQFSREVSYFDQILSAMACNNETGPFAGIDVQVKTLEEHLQAIRDENKTYPVDTFGDGMPVANPILAHHEAVWSGFFTTKSHLKGMIKAAGDLHRSVIATFTIYSVQDSKIEVELSPIYSALDGIRFNLGILQHHDAITGTCHKHVSADYLERIEEIRSGLDNLFADLAKSSLGIKPLGFSLNNTALIEANQTESTFSVFNYQPFPRSRFIHIRYPQSLAGKVVLLDQHNTSLPFSETCDDIVGCDATSVRPVLVPALAHRTFRLVRTDRPKAVQTVRLTRDSPTHSFAIANTSLTVTDGGAEEPGLRVTYAAPNKDPVTLHISLAAYDTSSLYQMNFISGHYCMVTHGDAAPIQYSQLRVQVDEATAHVTVHIFFERAVRVMSLSPWSPVQTRGNVKVQFSEEELRRAKEGTVVLRVAANFHPILRDEADFVLRYRVVGLENEGKFYVGSNGLEALETTLKKDKRIEYSYQPVSKFIQIKDPVRNLKLTVLNDRAQGGVSPAAGTLELDIARANNGRDMKGMYEALREPYRLSLRHTVVVEAVDSFEFRKQQVAADTPLLYLHHKPGKVNSVKRPPTNHSLPDYPYLRIQLEVKPDGYLVRFYNMHDEQPTTVDCLFNFLATLYSIDRPFSLQPRSLDYTLTREDVMAQNYLWRKKTSVIANIQEVQKGKPWTIGALSMATYKLAWV